MSSSSEQVCRPSGRAPALPPDERRRAIMDAVAPLLLEHGAGVTTRQIAEAAGVAEGTLFRVFDDKAALLHATVHSMLDPARTRQVLAGVDPDLPLEAMIPIVAERLLNSTRQVMAVLMALRGLPTTPGPTARPGPPTIMVESQQALLQSLTELLDRYRDELCVEPGRAALLLRALVFGAHQPWTDPADGLTSDEITHVLLSGIAGTRR